MIKKVDEVPMNARKKAESYREMIRNDIREAMRLHYQSFEFVGNYNFKYLAQYAREEARLLFRKQSAPVRTELGKELRAEIGEKHIWLPDTWEYADRAIKITSVKNGDSRRVFCTIDYDFIDNYKEILREDYFKIEKMLAERAKERQARRNDKSETHTARQGNYTERTG